MGKKKYGPDQGLPASPWPGPKASRPGPGLVQVPPKMSVRAQIIKNGPNRVQNRPFGLKLGPEACQDRSGAFGMGLTHSKGPSPVKEQQKVCPSRPKTMSGPAQIIKNGPNRVQNRRFGLKLGPRACQDPSGAFGMGLTNSKGLSLTKKRK